MRKMKKNILSCISIILLCILIYYFQAALSALVLSAFIVFELLIPITLLTVVVLTLIYYKWKFAKLIPVLQVLYLIITITIISLCFSDIQNLIKDDDYLILSLKSCLLLLICNVLYFSIIKKKFFPLAPFIMILMYIVLGIGYFYYCFLFFI